MPPLHPQITSHAYHESVVIGPGNTTPIVVDFSELFLPSEWLQTYTPLSAKYLELGKTQKLIPTMSYGDPMLKIEHPSSSSKSTIHDGSHTDCVYYDTMYPKKKNSSPIMGALSLDKTYSKFQSMPKVTSYDKGKEK